MFITFKVNEELLPATTVNADIAGDAFPLTGFSKVGVIFTWASLTGTLDAEYSLEVSNDGTNWTGLTTPVAVSGASDSDAVISSDAHFNYIRAKITQNNVTGGTISASITLKE